MEIKVDSNLENVRIDRFLKKNLKNSSLSNIYSLIRKGNIRVNGKKVKENYRLLINDNISTDFDIEIEEKKYNGKFKEIVVYEDDNYLIINKPKNVAIHSGTDNSKGLSEILNINFANRLDKKAKGLVIGCKNDKSLRHVTKLIREKKIVKKYEAISKYRGQFKIGDKFKIENKIQRDDNKSFISENGKDSLCYVEVKNIKDGKIYFEIDLITGRKHQIRISLSSIGYPIIGDEKYGKYKKEDELMLKCKYIKFDNFEFKI